METTSQISNCDIQELFLGKAKLFKGNNMDALAMLPDNSIDSVVTDPPYGISYLNNSWDIQVPTVEFWQEVYRVLKPGGHILSFSSARTYHRMTVNIEDAGFEIRDQIMWMYGQGMPKSLNVGKKVDQLQGNERAVLEVRQVNKINLSGNAEKTKVDYAVTMGETEWEGWGTGLKPAHEPICVGRKPIHAKTIAQNVLDFGTGAINVNECKIDSNDGSSRYPSNVIFDESGLSQLTCQNPTAKKFFYVSKPGVKEKALGFTEGRNSHPTVKPVSLMAYLCKLVTPKNGVILDPFMGSGTTGVSALCCGFNFIGMELGEEYFDISKTRISRFKLFMEFVETSNTVLPKVGSIKKTKKNKLELMGDANNIKGIWNNLPIMKVA